jgi:hypothetical protein
VIKEGKRKVMRVKEMEDKIIEVLLDNEGCISDGYVYYCDDIRETLKKIAIDILKVIEEKE